MTLSRAVGKGFALPSAAPAPPSDEEAAGEEDGVIRCICQNDEDDGYTVQCEKCHVWQHVACLGFPDNELPDQFLCERCSPRAGFNEKGKNSNARRPSNKTSNKEKDRDRDRDAKDDKARRKDLIKPSPKKHRKDTAADAKGEKENKDGKNKGKLRAKEKENGRDGMPRDRDEPGKQSNGPSSPPRKRQREVFPGSAHKTKPPSALTSRNLDPRPVFEKPVPLFPTSFSTDLFTVSRRKKSDLFIPKLHDAFETDYYIHAHGYSVTEFNVFACNATERHIHRICADWDIQAQTVAARKVEDSMDVDGQPPRPSANLPDDLYPITEAEFNDQIFSARAVAEEIETDEDGAGNLRQLGLFVAAEVPANTIVGEIIGKITTPLGLLRCSAHSYAWDSDKLLPDRGGCALFDVEKDDRPPILSSSGFPTRQSLLPPIDVDCRDRTRILLPPFVFPLNSRNLMHKGWPLVVDSREDGTLDSARYARWFCGSSLGENVPESKANACLKSFIIVPDPKDVLSAGSKLLNSRIRLGVVSLRPLLAGEEVILRSDLNDWIGYPCACGSDMCPVFPAVSKYENLGNLDVSTLLPKELDFETESVVPTADLSMFTYGAFSYLAKPDPNQPKVVVKAQKTHQVVSRACGDDVPITNGNAKVPFVPHHGGKKAWLKLENDLKEKEWLKLSNDHSQESRSSRLKRKRDQTAEDTRVSKAPKAEASDSENGYFNSDSGSRRRSIGNASPAFYDSSSPTKMDVDEIPPPIPSEPVKVEPPVEAQLPPPPPPPSVRKVTLKDFVKRGIPKSSINVLTGLPVSLSSDRLDGEDQTPVQSPTKEMALGPSEVLMDGEPAEVEKIKIDGSGNILQKYLSVANRRLSDPNATNASEPVPDSLSKAGRSSSATSVPPSTPPPQPPQQPPAFDGYFAVKTGIESLFSIQKSDVRSPPRSPPPSSMYSASASQNYESPNRRQSNGLDSSDTLRGRERRISIEGLVPNHLREGGPWDRERFDDRVSPVNGGLPPFSADLSSAGSTHSGFPFNAPYPPGERDRDREPERDWEYRRTEREREREKRERERDGGPFHFGPNPRFPPPSRPFFDRPRSASGPGGGLPFDIERERDRERQASFDFERDRDWHLQDGERERERERERKESGGPGSIVGLEGGRDRPERGGDRPHGRPFLPPPPPSPLADNDREQRTSFDAEKEREGGPRRSFSTGGMDLDERLRPGFDSERPERPGRPGEGSGEPGGSERPSLRERLGPRDRDPWDQRPAPLDRDRELRDGRLPPDRDKDPRDSRLPIRDRPPLFRERERERERPPVDPRDKERFKDDSREVDRERIMREREKERWERKEGREGLLPRDRGERERDREGLMRERIRDRPGKVGRLEDQRYPPPPLGRGDFVRLGSDGSPIQPRRLTSPKPLGSRSGSPRGRRSPRSPPNALADIDTTRSKPGGGESLLHAAEGMRQSPTPSSARTEITMTPLTESLPTPVLRKDEEEEGEVAEGEIFVELRRGGEKERFGGERGRSGSGPGGSGVLDRRPHSRNLSPPGRGGGGGGGGGGDAGRGKGDYEDRYRWDRMREPGFPAGRGGGGDRYSRGGGGGGGGPPGGFRGPYFGRDRERDGRDRERDRPLPPPGGGGGGGGPGAGRGERDRDRDRGERGERDGRDGRERMRGGEREIGAGRGVPGGDRDRDRDRPLSGGGGEGRGDRERDRGERDRDRERGGGGDGIRRSSGDLRERGGMDRDRERDRDRDRDRDVRDGRDGRRGPLPPPIGAGRREDDWDPVPAAAGLRGSRGGSPRDGEDGGSGGRLTPPVKSGTPAGANV
ncbi:hypothetical protein HDU97_000601 [Phlyctochytrium planicorne]|nr:hypothetical protein HDU97_000601 [Phlyctochytrium planicorne]